MTIPKRLDAVYGELVVLQEQCRLQQLTSPSLLKNIIENSLCNCGEIEDTFHFFFECNQYKLIGRDMITFVSAICNPILISLLHGNEYFSAEQNFNIINAAHKFIIKSKRSNLSCSI